MNRTLDAPFELKNLNSAGIFSGYGSVYDVVDQGDDIVAAGAFADSLTSHNSKGTMPALLWQHRTGDPIGAYTRMSEDPRGLFVEGQLALKTQRGAEAYELLKMKAVSGLSIGFMTREDSYDQKTGIRTVKKADLWEVSLVTFPMNDAARVDQVKAIPDFQSVSDVERFLRDAASLSKKEAATLTSKVVDMLRRDTGARSSNSQAEVLAAVERLTAAMRA